MSDQTTTPTVDVQIVHAPGAPWVAVVALHGEHDLATKRGVEDALRPIFGNVLVDLTGCTFIDSTIIGTLIVASQGRKEDGHHLELLVPAENEVVTRTLAIAGVEPLLTVHTVRPAQP